MIVLAFTTSTDRGSIALSKDGRLLAQTSWVRNKQGSEALTPKIKAMLAKKKITFKDLNLIAVDRGPGSFTGCRVAVNVAKTMAYTLGIPVFAPSSLEIVAFAAARKFFKTLGPFEIFTVFDAHRSLVYFSHFKIESDYCHYIRKPCAVSYDEVIQSGKSINPLMLAGNLATSQLKDLQSKIKEKNPTSKILVPKETPSHFPQAKALLHLAALASPSDKLSWKEIEPAYIRSPDVVEKQMGAR